MAAATSLAPIVLIIGDAGPLVEQAHADLLASALEGCAVPAFNHARYRAGEGAMDAVGTANTPPMMSERRVVEVIDLHLAASDDLEALTEYAQNPLDSTVLLLVGRSLPKSVKGKANFGIRLKNAVKKSGKLVEIKADRIDSARFAVDVAAAVGKELSLQDARMLVEWLGSDLSRLRSEVEKLALFVGDRRAITPQDVQQGSAMLGEAEVWALTGALTVRDVDQALGTMHRLVSSGDDPRRLMGLIVWQMREIVKVTEHVANGLSDGDIRNTGRVRPEIIRAVRRAGPDAPTAAGTLSRLARANRAMNEVKAGAERVLEELILELCR